MIPVYPKKRFYTFILIVLVNLILTISLIFGMEFVSSRFISKPGGNLVSHSRLNHTWRPNSVQIHNEWIASNPDFPHPYTHYYNRQGWLEKYDIQKKKPRSTYRVFYLGDSFIEGTCPMDQSLPSIVERRLNDMAKDNKLMFEVINTGTSSYSPTIFYLLVRYVLMGYTPDLVVINIDMTDDFDDWKYSQTLIRDNDGNPEFSLSRNIYTDLFIDTENKVLRATLWKKIQLFLIHNSYTYNLILYIKKKFISTNASGKKLLPNEMAQKIYQRWSWCRSNWDDFTAKNVKNTFDLLRRLTTFCRQNNIKIMFTSVPHYWQYAGNENGTGKPLWSNRPHYDISNLSKELDVPYLNSFEKLKPLIGGTPQKKFYYNGNMHFNPRGYAVWAEAHIEFLTTKEYALLPEPFYSIDTNK